MSLFEEYDWFDSFNDEVNRLLVVGKFPRLRSQLRIITFLSGLRCPGLT